MRIKIFSVRASEGFRAIGVGEESHKISADEYLQREVQRFLDENPDTEIKHVAYSATPIVPKTSAWATTNTPIKWVIEKCLVVFYQNPRDYERLPERWRRGCHSEPFFLPNPRLNAPAKNPEFRDLALALSVTTYCGSC